MHVQATMLHPWKPISSRAESARPLRDPLSAATREDEEDIILEPYRTAGTDVLLDRGLITATGHGYRPSDEVVFSLRLDCWQYCHILARSTDTTWRNPLTELGVRQDKNLM